MSLYSGYLSAIFITLSFVPYTIAVFKHQAKPERASWFIWAVLGGISFFSQWAKGATHSLWLPGIQGIGDLGIFILAIWYGMGGWQKRDKIGLVIAAVSLLLWYITKEPAVALFLAIIMDAVGGVLTAMKSYEHPATEPLIAWILTCLGGFFAIFAVGGWDWVLLAFPLYTFIINFIIIASILLGRRKRITVEVGV